MAYEIVEHGKLTATNNNDEPYSHTDMCEPYSLALIVETEDGADLSEDEAYELRSDLERRCGCAHDCCGHYNGGVNSITKIWPGRFIVLASYLRNY